MAKNKAKNSFWGKNKNDNDDYLNDNINTPQIETENDNIDKNNNEVSAYDINSNYADFLNDYNNEMNDDNINLNDSQDFVNDYSDDNYLSQDSQDLQGYDNNYLDQEYLKEDKPFDEQFSEDYLYDNQDNMNYEPVTPAELEISDAEEIDSLLKNISDKLEKLESKEKAVPANTPFYAQNPMPYVFIPNQNSGNEVILNELAKLREDNYRMQHSQEIQRQLTVLKDELNAKLAAIDKETKVNNIKNEEKKADSKDNYNSEAVLLDELKKINHKIEQLETKTSNNTSSQDLKQILDQINHLESRFNSKRDNTSISKSYDDELKDIINQIRNISLKNDDVLAYIKSLRNTLGLSAISHIDENGEVDYSDLDREYAEFKSAITTGNLYAKISAISRFNELIAELPAGEHEEIASEFYRIRNKVFGTILTPEIAAELIFNTTAADKEKDIYYYFELKGELERANTYDLAQVADEFLKLRNRLQNNQYVTYNQNLYNDLIEANSDYEYDQSALSKERLKRAKETFSTLRIGDIIPINDYTKIRPTQNYKTISIKLNDIYKLLQGSGNTALSELSTKLDTVIDDIKTTFTDKDFGGNSSQITQALDEITSLKENLVVIGEQRHQEIINEITAIKTELSDKNAVEQDFDLKAQLYALQEEIREKYLNNDVAILNSVNDIKEQLSTLSDYSELDDIPGISNEALLDEIKSLKEQLYVQKGEFDPEILAEIRNLKELLATSRKEESYSDIITGLTNIEKRLDETNKEERQEYQTVLTSSIEVLSTQIEQLSEKTEKIGQSDNEELLNEIAELKAKVELISIPTVVHEDGEKVKLDYTELNEQLDKINNALSDFNNLKGEDAGQDLAINIFKESMIEVLNEITTLKDEYIYQSERNDNIINEVNALKEQLIGYSSDSASKADSVLTSELSEIKELINNRLNDTDQNNQIYQNMLEELAQVKELIIQSTDNQSTISQSVDNTEVLKTLSDLKENFLISKADTDNSFIVETSSIREQLGALKKTLDFNKMSEDINGLKESIKDNQFKLDTQGIREIIREELHNTRASELTVGIAAIEKQMTEMRKELSRRHEADTATLNFMVQIAAMLDKQQNSDEIDNSSIISDVNKLKEEIDSLKTTKKENISEESEKFAKRLTSLKEELSQIAQIAELDEYNTDNTMKEAVAELDLDYKNNKDTAINEADESVQKELLRKQLLEGGLPQNSVDEIINSIYPEKQ